MLTDIFLGAVQLIGEWARYLLPEKKSSPHTETKKLERSTFSHELTQQPPKETARGPQGP